MVTTAWLLRFFYLDGNWWAFPPQGMMPVKIHDIIDLKQTKARRVQPQALLDLSFVGTASRWLYCAPQSS